jgi:hypothetical protein
MLTFLTITVIVAIASLAVTAYAILTARDGYEDELGFHAISSSDHSAGDDLADASNGAARSKPLAPFASARF